MRELKDWPFSPGGTGTIDGKESLKDKDVMILGQDFDTEKNFRKSLERGGESNSTWRNIKNLLNEAGISENRCFFTNAIMGLRREGKNSGPSPAFKDSDFMDKCRDFFLYQLRIQKPKVIFALGMQVAKFLACVPKTHLNDWSKVKSFSQIDSAEIAFKKDVRFGNNLSASVVLLIHPSFRPSNIGKRKYGDFIGNNAELEMIKAVLA